MSKSYQDLFTFSSVIHTTNRILNSAHKNFLHISSIESVTYGNKSIKFHCLKLWNDKVLLPLRQCHKNNVGLDKIYNKQYFEKDPKKGIQFTQITQ